MKGKAAEHLKPNSPQKSRLEDMDHGGLFTVQGRITSVSAIRRVDQTDGPIPIRNLELTVEDGSMVPVALWREAALEDVTANTFLSICHCRMTKHMSFGSKASTTNYTQIQEVSMPVTKVSITVNGFCITENEVLINTIQGAELKTSIDVVQKMAQVVEVEEIYDLLPLKVDVSLEGDNIVEVYK